MIGFAEAVWDGGRRCPPGLLFPDIAEGPAGPHAPEGCLTGMNTAKVEVAWTVGHTCWKAT